MLKFVAEGNGFQLRLRFLSGLVHALSLFVPINLTWPEYTQY